KWIDRVIYPLISRKGASFRPVGLAGRSLDPDGKYAKWMNSTDSDLYKKDRFWYGLHLASEFIVKKNEVWIVEGYNDVIAWQTNGIQNTVAPCGTAIAENQMKLLRKFTDHIVLCMDSDPAGIKAMAKHIPAFLAFGFRVQLVELPEGVDPDDFSREHPERMEEIKKLKFRVDGFKFLMNTAFKNKDAVGIAQETKKLVEVIQ